MSRKGKRRIGQCVYCGEEKELSGDHVPPKNLFKKPRPNNLITVDSCDKCNRSYQKDDEYFRAITATLEKSEKHLEAKELWETKIMPSYLKSNKIGFREMIRQSLKPIEILTEGGIFLGRRIGYEIDVDRFNNVIQRTIKGLFWHERRFRLSDEFEVKIKMQPDVREIKPEVLDAFAAIRPKIIGNNVFVYRALFFDEEPYGSGWLLSFYQSMNFICLTVPRNKN